MSERGIFVTGASGFVGRRLLPALARLGRPVIALDRSGRLAAGDLPPGASLCRGDLLAPETYAEALRGCDVVVHLAAATGKATAADHQRVNGRGTEALIDACRRSGTARLLFVSSIAVTFPDQTGYHYAVAKAAAERAVTASGLRTAIVRPTMVFGPGSPVEAGLAKLALLPAIVVPGSGLVRVQPVHVDDLVACLVEIVEGDRFAGEVLEVGGPDTVTIERLLQAIRVARQGAPAGLVHLPLGLLRGPVLLAEGAGLGAVLPVSAGQLASFANDGTAAPNSLVATQAGRMVALSGMLAGVADASPESARAAAVDDECRVFTRHLLGVEADAYVLGAYALAVARVPQLAAKTAFDDLLLACARRGAAWTRLADAYAALLARDSALRRRLVMVLAILETRAPFHELIDVPDGVPGPALWLRVSMRVVVGVLSTGAGVLLFVPARLATAVLGRAR